MKGFRPSFYNENPKLQSIEILAWAVKQPCFTLAEARQAFLTQLSEYKDGDHEISERIRKLMKSGMIVVADEGLLSAQEATLKSQDPVEEEEAVGAVTAERLSVIRQFLQESKGKKNGPGRPPRLYFTTQAAAKYVRSRSDDLPATGTKKTRKGPR